MEESKTIYERYLAAWAAVENPPLDSANSHFKNRYASLPAVLKAVRAACVPNGLAYRQHLSEGRLRSWVMDAEGVVLALSDIALHEDAKSQEVGSDLTYRKRQIACLDWGIVGEEDDDAKGGYSPVPQGARRDTVADAWQAAVSRGVQSDAIKAHMREAYGKERLGELNQAERMGMLQYLNDAQPVLEFEEVFEQ